MEKQHRKQSAHEGEPKQEANQVRRANRHQYFTKATKTKEQQAGVFFESGNKTATVD